MQGRSCEIELRVRYVEADPMGFLHHSRYFVFFEMGRTELLRQSGIAYFDLEAAGAFLVVARCSAKFLAPARYDDQLVLKTTLRRMSAVRIDHVYEMRRKDTRQVITEGESTLACVDRQGKVIPIPDSIRGAGEPS